MVPSSRLPLAGALALALVTAAPLAGAAPVLQIDRLWTHVAEPYPDTFGESAAEIVSHDAATQRVFVVNGYDNRIDVLDAITGARLGALDVSGFGSPNSVAVKNGKVAVAVQNADPQAAGAVVFFNANDANIATGGSSTGNATVGAMPDMVTFTPDGSKVLTANEGEPNWYGQGSVDPVGSVSIVDVGTLAVTSAGFTGFSKAALVADGVRVSSPAPTAAQDIEPEYITVSADGSTAYVTLQENNAIAEVNIAAGTVTAIRALGVKDHDLPGQAFDASDDEKIQIKNWPASGMYMPDSIASYQVGGRTLLVTANEGDTRDYENQVNGADDWTDEIRVKNAKYPLNPTIFPDANTLKEDDNLGRLTVSRVLNDGSVPAQYDQILAFGGRSFSIWDADTGDLVYDSGDAFEQITAMLPLVDQDGNPVFNSDSESNDSFDSRSDNKGPEPEALVVGEVDGYTLAFIGLERIGGIMIFDITDPANVTFLDYLLDRNFTVDADTLAAGDLGPEGMYFLTPDRSPTGRYGLLVANEVSGTTTYWDIAVPAPVPTPAPLALLALGLPLLRRRR